MFWLLNCIVDLEFLMKIEIGTYIFVGWILRFIACVFYIFDVFNEEFSFLLMLI